jgi:phosphohistidine swiveling domain-containing protein
MLQAGLPVPAGFVVPDGLVPSARALARACRRAGIATAAVRSSAEGEDGSAQSMAGMFKTELDIPAQLLSPAIAAVRASYGGRHGGVVVQAFQRAEHAGVLFTSDPAHAGRMLVELVAGGGDALVSGRATPQTFRFGRVTGERVGAGSAPPIDLAELLELGRRVEALFGRPQDIEWVHRNGRFLLVQARDITRTAADRQGSEGIVEAERARLLAAVAGAPARAEVLAQTEIAELLPAPTTYSLSLFESLWAPGGTVDRACRALGVPYDVAPGDRPCVVSAFGRCYVDQRERARRSRRQLGAVASFRLTAAAGSVEADLQQSLPALRRRVLQLEALEPARLPLDELLALCEDTRLHFEQETYVRAEMINLLAEFFVGAARRQAKKRGADAATLLADGGNVVSEAFARLCGDGPVGGRVDAFTRHFGHRAAHDFELAEPRYREVPERVAGLARAAGGRERRTAAVANPTGVLGVAVDRARACQRLKEEAKHEAMRELAALRALLLAVGERCGIGESVFDLTPAEVARLAAPEFRGSAAALAGERRQRREALLAVDVPTALTPAALERLGEPAAAAMPAGDGLCGTRVAGGGDVTGRVRVLRDPGEIGGLQPGEILVTRCTDPCWLPAFAVAGGLVTEIGGWLSHAAIQAREQDLPTIVGAAGSTTRLRDGDLVRLGRDGAVSVLAEQRHTDRRGVDLAASLHWQGSFVAVRVVDLSCLGAGVEVPVRSLPAGADLELRVAGVAVPATLAWANCQRVGLRFAQPLPVETASGRWTRSA